MSTVKALDKLRLAILELKRDQSFSTCENFFEKLTFLPP